MQLLGLSHLALLATSGCVNELESGVDDAEMITWLNAVLAGESPTRKPRKPRAPLSDEQKAAFRDRMVAGQEAAAKAKAKAKANKKPASRKKK